MIKERGNDMEKTKVNLIRVIAAHLGRRVKREKLEALAQRFSVQELNAILGAIYNKGETYV